jgi:hypothetical protein
MAKFDAKRRILIKISIRNTRIVCVLITEWWSSIFGLQESNDPSCCKTSIWWENLFHMLQRFQHSYEQSKQFVNKVNKLLYAVV